jgi:hypothetical protein
MEAEVIIAALGIAACGFIIGNVLGYSQGLEKGQQIVKEVYKEYF